MELRETSIPSYLFYFLLLKLANNWMLFSFPILKLLNKGQWFLFFIFLVCVYIYIYIYKHLKWGMRFKHWTSLLETPRFWEVSINIKLMSFFWTPMNKDLLMGVVNYLYEIKYKLWASTSMVLKLLKSYFSNSNIKKPPTLMVI